MGLPLFIPCDHWYTIYEIAVSYFVNIDIVHCDTVEERLSTWATRHGLPSDDITTLPTFDTSSASSNLSTGLDGLFTEQLAETFLTKFLDTKRIEDFVKSIPAGQEPLELFATIPKSTLPLSKGKAPRL